MPPQCLDVLVFFFPQPHTNVVSSSIYISNTPGDFFLPLNGATVVAEDGLVSCIVSLCCSTLCSILMPMLLSSGWYIETHYFVRILFELSLNFVGTFGTFFHFFYLDSLDSYLEGHHVELVRNSPGGSLEVVRDSGWRRRRCSGGHWARSGDRHGWEPHCVRHKPAGHGNPRHRGEWMTSA